jgi:HEAT repeat protein
VIDVYLAYLKHENPEIRYDSLVLLQSVTEPGDCVDAYCGCLLDEDSRIRLLALERLSELKKDMLLKYKKKIRAMFSDPDVAVQATAKKIMNRISANAV